MTIETDAVMEDDSSSSNWEDVTSSTSPDLEGISANLDTENPFE
jgi:hypothetical protein